jgi:hypothetical protein
MTNWFRNWLLVMSLIAAGAIASPLAAAKDWGEEWGDWCLQNATSTSITRERQCCQDKHDGHPVCQADPKQAACVQGLNVCWAMIGCNHTLDECKKREMETDKDCSQDKCKQCTDDYKMCHDNAVR